MSAPMEFASVPVPILSRPISAAFAAEVMTAVQTLRAEAKAKGNLKSTSQMTVVQQSPQVIGSNQTILRALYADLPTLLV
jgi:hypothetical protein